MTTRVATDPHIRFERKYRVEDNGCWVWTSPLAPNGYASFAIQVDPVTKGWSRVYAHRFAYETYIGPIPDGLDLDHLCRNRSCVNPHHLEPVTRRENLRRGRNANREKTHCAKGHQFTPANTHFVAGRQDRRKCITCMRARDKARWQAHLRGRVLEGGPAL